MSPSAGQTLLDKIAPRLRSTIPRSVTPCGAEDQEELLQDAITVAAQMLHGVEATGKDVTPGNIAYYVILHMKSGRRSQSGSRADVMAPGTQLDQRSSVRSTEDEIGYDPESGEPVTLGDLLAADREDPSTLGARNMDWDEFLGPRDARYSIILKGIVEGRTLQESAGECGLRRFSVYGVQRKLARELREYLGSEAIPDAMRVPFWRGDIMAGREKAACRSSR
jgi:hypothetical protein